MSYLRKNSSTCLEVWEAKGGGGSELGSPDHSRCDKSCNSSTDCGGYCPHCATAPGMGGVYRCFAAPPTDPADAR